MAEQDDDSPVRFAPTQCVEERLVSLKLWNISNAQPGRGDSVRVGGELSFGVAPRVSPNGTTYEVGLRCAFLRAMGENCDFVFHPEIERVLQQGAIKKKETDTGRTQTTGKIEGQASFRAGLSGLFAGVRAKAEGARARARSSVDTLDLSQTIAVVQRSAGGVRIGHADAGDPLNHDYDGVLTKTALEGDLGELRPHGGQTAFRCSFQVLAGQAWFTVRPAGGHWSKPRDRHATTEAFDALKSEVAAWIVGDAVATAAPFAAPQGYDSKTGELALALGVIDVDLNRGVKASEPSCALPPPQATPLPPAPVSDADAVVTPPRPHGKRSAPRATRD